MTVSANQFLHGYSDGHRLLAGSAELPHAVMRRLLVHSDAVAGPRGELSLSSLPMPEEGYWALTATWRADEMPRPGSVWSHSLVLDFQAVQALRHAGGLLSVLRRPNGLGDMPTYRNPLAVPDLPVVVPGPEMRRAIAAALLAFYGWPEDRTAVLVPTLEVGQRALLAVWEQQWPELRAAASFAARARLDSDDASLVQLAEMRGRGRARSPLIDATIDLSEPSPDWIAPLVADVEQPGALRRFLSAFGPESEGAAAAMRALVELHLAFSSSNPELAFERLIELFPQPSNMPALKAAVLRDGSELWRGPDEERVVAAYEHHGHVRWGPLELGERLARLWPSAPTSVFRCLSLAQEESSLAQVAWGAVAPRADAGMLADMAAFDLPLAIELASQRPDLLVDPSLWRSHAAWQEPLALAVSERRPLDGAFAGSVIAASNTRLAAALVDAGALDGGAVATAIVNDGMSARTWRTYREVFAGNKDAAIRHALEREASWMERLFAALLGGVKNPVVSAHAGELAKHLRQLDETSQIELASRLLLAEDGGLPSKPVMRAIFPVLHRALVTEDLPRKIWKELDRSLPAGNSWDRAERLRLLLLESIRRHDWSEREIAEVIERAGPEAEKLRDLTDKKSDLRAVLDAAWDLLTPWW